MIFNSLNDISQYIMKMQLILDVKGTVQGVGFRPTIYHYAKSLNLLGTIEN